ncbi:MAG TPA: autotransporter outer membrane beta-barrel domain-containing protein [Devosiaceae bacterium]|jgi:outer membrane autotransporter protein
MLGGALLISTGSVQAACSFAPTAGDNAYVCDSGTSAGLTDTGGNNSLTFPAGGTGVINGAVAFTGNGVDTIRMDSGTITGAVSQGSGIDDFVMSAGQIASLQQGDGYDNFSMSGGTITGAFEDGDYAVMTGGTIGRVDMKLADNFFYLSGGRINGNLVTGFGLDTIDVSGGIIGGNISVSGGNDVIHITGGKIAGEIRASFGNDALTWENGGAVFSDVLMGQDADIATLSGLTESELSVTPHIDGGVGTDARATALASDVLIFDRTQSENGARYTNWETISLTNGSTLTLDGRPLILGGSDTTSGSFAIDARSRLYVDGNAAISPFGAGLAAVTNAGAIDMHQMSAAPTDTLTIKGDYEGLGGSMLLDTFLGTDGSRSDRLVIDGGNASGLTGLDIINAGGPGASTSRSGIMVVQATNGGTTNGDAFALDRAVAAGAYEYLLFKGGVEAGTADNWYLRSNLIALPTPPSAVEPPEPPAPPPPPPAPPSVEPPPTPPPASPPVDPGTPDPETQAPVVPADPPVAPPVEANPVDSTPTFPSGTSQPTPVIDPSTFNALAIVPPTPDAVAPGASLLAAGGAIPLYRLEAATYAVIPVAAYQLGLQTLSTLDERRGGQEMIGDPNQAAWARVFGQHTVESWGGTVAPTIDGGLAGVQAGIDLLDFADGYGHTTAGLFVGTAHMEGDIRGFALGWADYDVGRLSLNTTSLGAYATYVAPSGAYLDGVLMGTWLGGSATSSRDISVPVDGFGVTASLEGGYPFQLEGGWRLEPQAQIIWQGLSLDDQTDPFAAISFEGGSGFTGRLGVRLDNRFDIPNGTFAPALFANLWHDFGRDSITHLDADTLTTPNHGTSLELGGGFSSDFDNNVSLFGNVSHTFGLSDTDRSSTKAQLGLQVSF